MRFRLPLSPVEFEIPDDWWSEGGMSNFKRESESYLSNPNARLVRLRDVEPPFRFPEHPLDWNGFGRERFVSILKGFVSCSQIEPVPTLEMPSLEFGASPFTYRVRDGFHRYYASVAAGYEKLPITL